MPDLLKIIITPAALVLGALIGTWRNGLDLGLQGPTVQHTVTITVVFVVLLALFELLYRLPAPLAGTGGRSH